MNPDRTITLDTAAQLLNLKRYNVAELCREAGVKLVRRREGLTVRAGDLIGVLAYRPLTLNDVEVFPEPPPPAWIGSREASKIARMTPGSLQNWWRNGRIRAKCLKNKMFYSRSEMEAIAARRKQLAEEGPNGTAT